MTEIKPVVVEFISPDYPYKDAKHYYLGKSEKDILKSTNNGKGDYVANFKEKHKIIPLKKAEKLNLGFYRLGYELVLEKGGSFKLKTPGGYP